jgi:hypothetical protein
MKKTIHHFNFSWLAQLTCAFGLFRNLRTCLLYHHTTSFTSMTLYSYEVKSISHSLHWIKNYLIHVSIGKLIQTIVHSLLSHSQCFRIRVCKQDNKKIHIPSLFKTIYSKPLVIKWASDRFWPLLTG